MNVVGDLTLWTFSFTTVSEVTSGGKFVLEFPENTAFKEIG